MISRTRFHHARLVRASLDLPAAADVYVLDRERERILRTLSPDELAIMGELKHKQHWPDVREYVQAVRREKI